MPVLKLTRLAYADVDQILEGIRLGSSQAADSVDAAIERTFAMLSEHPRAGQERPELALGLRSIPLRKYKNYLVFYRPLPDVIEIIRVVHGARDLLSIFHQSVG
jgi:toxin ParE1/3/4